MFAMLSSLGILSCFGSTVFVVVGVLGLIFPKLFKNKLKPKVFVIFLGVAGVLFFLALFFILSTPTNTTKEDFQKAISETMIMWTEEPTYTPYPTYTPFSTNTPYPTYTAQPTSEPIIITATSSPTPKFTPTDTATPTVTPTFTATFTPTKTFTLTPTPNQTKTQQAIINATKGADATATKIAANIQATEIAQYEKIDYKELSTYPDAHIGEMVWVEGRIFNILNNEEMQIYLGWTYDPAYLITRDKFSGVYEDDFIKVYGTVLGEHCGENAFGGQICQPVLFDVFFTKK